MLRFDYLGSTYEVFEDRENEVKLMRLSSSCKDLYIPKYALHDGKQYLVTSIEPGKKTKSWDYNVEKDGRKRPKWERRYYNADVNVFYEEYNSLRTIYPIVTINFHNAMRVIGDYAFSDVETFDPLTLKLPQSLEKIGKYAFSNCKKLEIGCFPDNLKTIGDYAFSGCEQIKTLLIPDSVSSIGKNAFYECSSLKYLTIGSGVKVIEAGAFARCDKFMIVHIYNDPFEVMIAPNAFPSLATIKYHKADEHRRKYLSDDKVKALSKLMGMLKFFTSNNTTNFEHANDCNNKSKETLTNAVVLDDSVAANKQDTVINLDKLIDAVVADGVITDKERAVILKKAVASGYDSDEVEILLDAKLYEVQQKNKNSEPNKKRGKGRKDKGYSIKVCH